MQTTRDMTVGSPGRLMLGFAVPLLIGNVFQQLYTFADTIIVGQALGVKALAAVGAVEWMIFLLFGFIQGLTQGFSVAIAQRFGAADYKGVKKAVISAVYLSAAGAVLFTLAGLALIYPVLRLLHTPDEIIGLSHGYLRILYAGLPITMAYNLFSAILRALGNSRTPLRAMTAASLCNIVLDILFVFGFGWGMEGAALGTVLAQLLATVLCFVQLHKIEILRFTGEECRMEMPMLLEQCRLGIPMGLQNMITAVGGMVVQSVINGFGVLFIAGYTAANKLYGLLEIAASSYGYGMSTYTGQNLGAGLYDRIRKGLRAASAIGIVTALLMSTIMLVLGKKILRLFLAGDVADVNAAIGTGYHFLIVLACFFPLLYLLYITRACVQGMGNSILPMFSSGVQLVMRCGCALTLPLFIGESGVFYGEVLAWIGADIMLGWWIKVRFSQWKGREEK
ncbi:putative MATE family efflux protein [Kineothrix alysoides]|uniref:Probable multidrug resistance protein NorM n=1 Tax=Kineothrix alysoides TaxID=1469948 RepID=A0A4R1R127_9FIRM|nr:MATE family efflux transporter [Kineothrix alysoides]TCL59014.1 putative MATE family efflux protein [Kineothrix alysoides]